ncbi:MAG TPA: glycosyltransferase family 2 protein [Candidatus Nitrosopolaris sp.]|nr:glycosyltransferase family 2 protein [Candidatus Nitrosopolaris sp.]
MLNVTVGISTFNEEKNILNLLESIIRQRSDRFVISEILISDDSSDNTSKLIGEFSSRNSQIDITCMHHTGRNGIGNAWNEIFQNAKGDAIVLYDGDVVPHKHSIEHLTAPLNGRTALCISNSMPIKSISVAGRAATYVSSWLRGVRNQRLSQYTALGRGLSIRTDVARHIIIPLNIIAVDLYLQCKVLEANMDVIYNDLSIVHFRPPEKISDFNSQVIRSLNGHRQIKGCIKKFKIRLPWVLALAQTIRLSLSDPLGAIAVGACYCALPYHTYRLRGLNSSKWHIAESTKDPSNTLFDSPVD